MSSTVRDPNGTQINDGTYRKFFAGEMTVTSASPPSFRFTSSAAETPAKLPRAQLPGQAGALFAHRCVCQFGFRLDVCSFEHFLYMRLISAIHVTSCWL